VWCNIRITDFSQVMATYTIYNRPSWTVSYVTDQLVVRSWTDLSWVAHRTDIRDPEISLRLQRNLKGLNSCSNSPSACHYKAWHIKDYVKETYQQIIWLFFKLMFSNFLWGTHLSGTSTRMVICCCHQESDSFVWSSRHWREKGQKFILRSLLLNGLRKA